MITSALSFVSSLFQKDETTQLEAKTHTQEIETKDAIASLNSHSTLALPTVPLIYNDEFFDGIINTANLSCVQVNNLVSGYFRIYDTLAQNPKEIFNIVKNYYGRGTSVIHCKCDHKPRMLLINKPIQINHFKIAKQKFQNINIINNNNINSQHQKKYIYKHQKLQVGLENQNNIIDDSIQFDEITFKFKYITNGCNKHLLQSWSQIGLIKIENQDCDYKLQFNPKTKQHEYSSSSNKCIFDKVIPLVYQEFEKQNFANFNDAVYKLNNRFRNVYKYPVSFSIIYKSYDHITPNRLLKKCQKPKSLGGMRNDQRLRLNDAVELNIFVKRSDKSVADFNFINARFSVVKEKAKANNQIDESKKDQNQEKEDDKRNKRQLSSTCAYIPGIAFKGCNCVKPGGTAYQVSWVTLQSE